MEDPSDIWIREMLYNRIRPSPQNQEVSVKKSRHLRELGRGARALDTVHEKVHSQKASGKSGEYIFDDAPWGLGSLEMMAFINSL